MSATINCKQFAEYFATPVRGKMNPAYVFEVDGAPYAVEEFYLDDLHNLFPYRVMIWLIFTGIAVLCVVTPNSLSKYLCVLPHQVDSPHPDDPKISVEMYSLAISLIQSFDEMEGKDSRWSLSVCTSVRSDTLFSPTCSVSYWNVCLYVSSKAEKESGMTLSERGSVLVFLPGLHEISYMQEALAKLVHKR